MTTQFHNAEELLAAEGLSLGVTDWLEITQERVDLFAEATGDHQWIHVEPERAKDGPFGGCIAHGYLTLSLVNLFLPQLIEMVNLEMGVNVGCERIRFPAPVPVGSRIRGRGEILSAEPVKGTTQAIIRVTVEIEGSERPACVVDTISRYTFDTRIAAPVQ